MKPNLKTLLEKWSGSTNTVIKAFQKDLEGLIEELEQRKANPKCMHQCLRDLIDEVLGTTK